MKPEKVDESSARTADELSPQDELEALRTELNAQLERSDETFVSFHRHHMHLDLRGFLQSEQGKASLNEVIALSQSIPTKRPSAPLPAEEELTTAAS